MRKRLHAPAPATLLVCKVSNAPWRCVQCLFRNRCGQMDLPPGTAAEDVGKFDGRYTLTVGALNAKLDELVLVGGGRGAAPAAAEQASALIKLM